jgi:anti-anti-sigma regulatory factor
VRLRRRGQALPLVTGDAERRIVDLTGVKRLKAADLLGLVDLVRTARQHGGDVRLESISGTLQRSFRRLRLDALLEVPSQSAQGVAAGADQSSNRHS